MVRPAVAIDDGRELLELELFADAIRKLIVMLPVWILGPGIEAPVGKRDALMALDEDRPGVACPDTVGGPDVELHTLCRDLAAFQHLARGLLLACGRHNQVYVFMAGNVADD